MQSVVLMAIAASAALAMFLLIRRYIADGAAPEPLAVVGIFTITITGFIYDTRLMPKGQAVQLGLVALLGVLVLIAFVRSARSTGTPRHPGLPWAVFLPAVISGILFVVNVIMNQQSSLAGNLERLGATAYLVLLVAFCILSQASIRAAVRSILLAILALLVLIPFLAVDSWRACDQFKCGPFGAIFVGPFASENGLAIILSVGVLCILGDWNGPRCWAVLLPLGLALFATESRTSQLALIVGVGVWVWAQVSGRNSAQGFSRKGSFLWTLVICAFFVTGLVLAYTSSPSDFSNRGNIWIRGTHALGDNWVFGLGLDRWTYLQSVGYLPGLFPHSQYLLVLFSGGVLSVFGLFLLFVASIRSEHSLKAQSFVAAYVTYLGVLGITEVYWNPIAIDGHMFIVLPLVIALFTGLSRKSSGLHGSNREIASFIGKGGSPGR